MDTPQAITSRKKPISGAVVRIVGFYTQGFQSMVLGRTLWKIIALKLLIMFAVLKLFFFPDFLASTYKTDEERAAHVLEEITATSQSYAGIVVQGPMKAAKVRNK